jgi:hypothetical protein
MVVRGHQEIESTSTLREFQGNASRAFDSVSNGLVTPDGERTGQNQL